MANQVKRLAGKAALVTGGTRGIGLAIAAAYAREGARVFICGRSAEGVDRAVQEIHRQGGEIGGTTGDVGRGEDAQRIVRAAADRYGTVSVLVNNASLLGPRVPISEYPRSEWEEVIRVNLTGPFLMTQSALKFMTSQGQGSIINVTSGVGRIGKARWGAYCPSKFALEGFTQMLAEELKDSGIRVNSLNPGPTRTSMRRDAYPEEDPLTLAPPESITEAFIYLASDDSAHVTGRSLDAQGQWREG